MVLAITKTRSSRYRKIYKITREARRCAGSPAPGTTPYVYYIWTIPLYVKRGEWDEICQLTDNDWHNFVAMCSIENGKVVEERIEIVDSPLS